MRTLALAGCLISVVALAGCQTAQERAASDDAKCREYGATPGSDAYVQCRMLRDERRAARRREAFDEMGALGTAMIQTPQTTRLQTSCTTTTSPGGMFTNTNCY